MFHFMYYATVHMSENIEICSGDIKCIYMNRIKEKPLITCYLEWKNINSHRHLHRSNPLMTKLFKENKPAAVLVLTTTKGQA